MDPQNPNPAVPGAAELTASQLRGLAMLGGVVDQLGATFAGGAGAAATGALRQAGDLYERYDLPALLEEVLGTAKALRDSGLLKLIRDNAELVVQTIELLAPLTAKAVESANGAPSERWKQNIATADRLLTELHALREFVDSNLAGELTAAIVKLTALAEETDAQGTLSDAFRTIARLRANGTLQRLVDISDYVAAFSDNADVGDLVGGLVDKASGSSLVDVAARTLRTPRLVGEAIEDARQQLDSGKDGGWGGLLRLLKDPEVQRSIRMYAHISAYIQKAQAKSAA